MSTLRVTVINRELERATFADPLGHEYGLPAAELGEDLAGISICDPHPGLTVRRNPSDLLFSAAPGVLQSQRFCAVLGVDAELPNAKFSVSY